MPHLRTEAPFDSAAVLEGLTAYCQRKAQEYGGTKAVQPPHRIQFHWPPHSVSHKYHVIKSDWTGKLTLQEEGEEFEVTVAKTPYGVFGKIEALWCDAKGDDEEQLLENLRSVIQPLLARQRQVAKTLGLPVRFSGQVRELTPLQLLQLFYCEDRDIAYEAHQFVEVSRNKHDYFPSLCAILTDRVHPWRRSAQWCVLDLFEDLPCFIAGAEEELMAVQAMQSLLMDAEDDYARTVYKAGVVLGGHIPHRHGGKALLECLDSPSAIGRRSAIHGLFHVCEWVPEMSDEVVHALRQHGKGDPDPQLSIFSFAIAEDIMKGTVDHTPEPIFAFEN